jgi:hypothetical protein
MHFVRENVYCDCKVANGTETLDMAAAEAGTHLNFNVAGVDDVAFDVAVSVAESGLCLTLSGAQKLEEVLLPLSKAHAAPSPTSSSLDHQWESYVVCHLHHDQHTCSIKSTVPLHSHCHTSSTAA